MMRIRPTSEVGRTVEIDTPYLKATIIDGEVAVWEPRTPAPPASRGLGDTVAKLAGVVGVKSCVGCKRRQSKLNKLVPYKRKD